MLGATRCVRPGWIRRRLIVALLAVPLSTALVWFVGRPFVQGQRIVNGARSATTSFHWADDQHGEGDCLVTAARACADDASQAAFCRQCVDPMIWADLPLPRLVALERHDGATAWHLAALKSWGVVLGEVDVWIDTSGHPLEARLAYGFVRDGPSEDTIRYTCINSGHHGPPPSAPDGHGSPPTRIATAC